MTEFLRSEEIQKLSCSELKELQLKLLQRQISMLYEASRFYRDKFKKANLDPSDIKDLSDLTKIPFTTRQELEQNFFEVLAVPYSQISTIRLSSGTTGSPLRIAHTKRDVEMIADASARRLAYHGVTSEDVVQITSAYGLWQGAWSMHWGAEKVGACVLPVGPADSERQILLIKQLGTTVLYAATNYHLRLLEVAKSLGEDLRRYHLRVAFCVAEKPTKNQVLTLKKECGYEKVVSDYGATEFPGFSVNCKEDIDAHHVWADYYLVEVVDSVTHQPVEEGKKGELVITSLQREAFPLIRYLSRDITSLFVFQTCSCGLNHPKISAEIDREDFMTKIRGVTVFPSHVEALLNKYPELSGKVQIIVDKRTPQHETTLRVEVKAQLPQFTEQSVRRRIISDVKNRVGITFNEIVFLPSGKFENKYKKVIIQE